MWPVEFQGCLRCCDPRSLKQVLREMRRQEEKHPPPAFFQIRILSPCPSCTFILPCQMHFLLPLPSLQLSEDESDLEISSLEDLPQDVIQREKPKPLSRSKLPEKIGATSWSPGQPRAPGW